MTAPRVTAHAIAQYLARSGRQLSQEAAADELLALVARAHFVRQEAACELWRVGGSKRRRDRWRFRVVAGSIVTVLPPCEAGRRDR